MFRDFNLKQDVLLQYPHSDYSYVIIKFSMDSNKIEFVEEEFEYLYDNVYKCYFIFDKPSWYVQNEARRKSYYFSKSTYHEEYSIFMFKQNLIDISLFAIVNENNKLIELDSIEKKKRINILILEKAVDKYVDLFYKNSKFNIDFDKLTIDVHAYLKSQIDIKHGKSTPLMVPKAPSALMLVDLIQTFPSMRPNELLEIDEGLLQLMDVVMKQRKIAEFEDRNYNNFGKNPGISNKSQ